MNHKTKWREVQKFLWTCDGCCRECMLVCKEPIQEQDCSGSNERILQIVKECKGMIQGGSFDTRGGA